MQNSGSARQEEWPTTGNRWLDTSLDQMHDAGRVALYCLLTTREQKTPDSLHDRVEQRLAASIEGVIDENALQSRIAGADSTEAGQILQWLRWRDSHVASHRGGPKNGNTK